MTDLLVVLRAIRLRADTPDDPYDTETINLTLCVGRHVLVTVHADPAPSVDAVVDLVQRQPDLLARGAGRLAHLVCDNAVDANFPLLDQLDEFIDGIEERVVAPFDNATLQEIFRAKRLVLTLRCYLVPQRDAFNARCSTTRTASPSSWARSSPWAWRSCCCCAGGGGCRARRRPARRRASVRCTR